MGASATKLAVYRLLEYRPIAQLKHLARVERAVAGRPFPVGLRSILVGAIAFVAFGWGAFWLASRLEAPGRYVTKLVDRGSVMQTIEIKGLVEPARKFLVTPRISGAIQSISCDIDMQVEKGQICARVDPRPYEEAVAREKADLAIANAQLSRAEAEMARTKIALERARRERRRGRISRYELEERKSDYDSAAAQIELREAARAKQQVSLRTAQGDLAATDVVTPARGTIVSRRIALGQVVAPQVEAPALFTIAGALAQMRAVAHVPEREIGDIKPGDKAQFFIETFPGRAFEAVVAELRLTRTTRNAATYDVVLDVDNSKKILKAGMTVTARIITARRDDVLRTPDRALAFSPRGVAAPPPLGAAQSRVSTTSTPRRPSRSA